jgi:hypothetical protein
MFNAAWTTQQ